MFRQRLTWVRGLKLYHADTPGAPVTEASTDAGRSGIRARSRFRSVLHESRYAVYTVRETESQESWIPRSPVEAWVGEHSLSVVREFRRVPLQASALNLALFTAQPARAASVVATLAHFAEQAVSLYQPSYLLLAHSREAPWVSTLVMGVQEGAALLAASPAAFSLDALLPELRPMLAADPEWYAYDPEAERALLPTAVSPSAV
jgi:hypothetical protein